MDKRIKEELACLNKAELEEALVFLEIIKQEVKDNYSTLCFTQECVREELNTRTDNVVSIFDRKKPS